MYIAIYNRYKNILSNYLILHMFGAFVVKKWHFPPESPEFRPKFPEFCFLNLNSPSVRKMRFSAEFRFRWSPGFVKKRKDEPCHRLTYSEFKSPVEKGGAGLRTYPNDSRRVDEVRHAVNDASNLPCMMDPKGQSKPDLLAVITGWACDAGHSEWSMERDKAGRIGHFLYM